MFKTILDMFDYLANQYFWGSKGLETVLNLQECVQKEPLEWRASLNNISKVLEKWEWV